MIRQQLFNELRRQYGEPTRNPDAEWWTIGGRRPYPVHLCLNERTHPDEAHLIIYDPRKTEGTLVVEVRVTSSAEIDDLCARIARIVKDNGFVPGRQ